MTNKEKKKAKIKEIFLKIFNVLCYIATALFIIILIIVGVHSCKQKNVNNNVNNVSNSSLVIRRKQVTNLSNNSLYEDYESYNFYELSFVSGSRISPNDQDWLSDFDISTSTVVSSSSPVKYYYLFRNDNQQYDVYVYDDTYGQCVLRGVSVAFVAFPYTLNSSQYYYRIDSVFASFFDGSGTQHSKDLLNKAVAIASDNYYTRQYNTFDIVADKGVDFYNEYIEYFYTPHTPTSFIFNKVFNYNAPFKSTINSVYGTSGSFTHISEYGAYIDYDVGYFISNDMLFNKVRIHYYNSAWILINNDVTQMPSDNYTYAMLEYVNSDNSYSLAVNIRDKIPYSYNGGSTYYFSNSSTWVNDSFRKIIFLERLSQDMSVQINAFNNNNQNSVSGYIGAGDVSDVFSLVASSFIAWLPVMNITILPGITLGILIFIPLVATLVFAIIRIIKK